MKVLLLQSKPFLPVLDGGNEASRALVKELLELDYELEILTFSSKKHPFNPELFKSKEWKELSIENVRVNLETNIFGGIKSMLKGESYNLSRFTDPLWISKIEEKKSIYDYIIIDSLYSGQEMERIKKKFYNAQLICRTHNVESQIWHIQSKKESSILRKKYVAILANQLEKREKSILKQCDLVLPISQIDKDTFESWGLQNTQLLPYFPIIKPSIPEKLSSDFFFLGSMNWQPNIHAHKKLADIILPSLFNHAPDSKMRFAGGHQDDLQKINSTQVEYVGFVNDKDKFIRESGILLAPIESGSGVRIKLIEALASGVPCVTTRKGAEGIDIKNGDGIFIAKNDDEFNKYALDLHQNEELRTETANKAIENVRKWKEKYNLKSIFEKHAR